MQESTYQATKIWLQAHLGLERDTFHYLIGAVLFAGAVLTYRRWGLRVFVWAFALAFASGCVMELLDLRDDLASLGTPRWQTSAHDLARTVVLPAFGLLVVAMIRLCGRAPGK